MSEPKIKCRWQKVYGDYDYQCHEVKEPEFKGSIFGYVACSIKSLIKGHIYIYDWKVGECRDPRPALWRK